MDDKELQVSSGRKRRQGNAEVYTYIAIASHKRPQVFKGKKNASPETIFILKIISYSNT